MRILILVYLQLFALSAWAGQAPVEEAGAYEAAPGLDLDQIWLDPAQLVKVVNYDAAAHVFEVTDVEDPTFEKIFATPESLAKSVVTLNLEMLKKYPAAIVGHQYELDHELVLLESDDLGSRKASFASTKHSVLNDQLTSN